MFGPGGCGIGGISRSPAHYSMSEINTGAIWVDGKQIYRKVVSFDQGPNAAPSNILVSFDTFDTLISFFGAMQNNLGDFLPLAFVAETEVGALPDCLSIKLIASGGAGTTPDSVQLTPLAGTDYSSFHGFIIIEYTK